MSFASDSGSEGPDPLAPVGVVPSPEIELNAEAAGAGSGGAIAPAADVIAGADTGTSGVVGIFGALKNGAGSQGLAATPVAATTGVAAGGADGISVGFGDGRLETEPKDCAVAGPERPGNSIPTSTAAMARCFIGRRL